MGDGKICQHNPSRNPEFVKANGEKEKANGVHDKFRVYVKKE
jgi:hypothetical protein